MGTEPQAAAPLTLEEGGDGGAGVKREFLSSFVQSPSYPVWRDVGAQRGMSKDEDIARFLLQYYQDTWHLFPWGNTTCLTCGASLSISCPHCKDSASGEGGGIVKTKEEEHNETEDDEDGDDGEEMNQSCSELSQLPVGKIAEAVPGFKEVSIHPDVPIAPMPPEPSQGTLTPLSPLMPVCQRYLPLMREDAGQSERPVYVNAKQYTRILKRREARKRLETCGKLVKERQKYLHLSRHNHAVKRERGTDGRYLPVAEEGDSGTVQALKAEVGGGGKRRDGGGQCGSPAPSSLTGGQVEGSAKTDLTVTPLPPVIAQASEGHTALLQTPPHFPPCHRPGPGPPSSCSLNWTAPPSSSSCKPSLPEAGRKTARLSSSLLKARKRPRGAAKLFVCEVCSKSFTRANNLKKHRLIHAGLKPFLCEVCSKAFTRVDDLKKHRIVHTGHKPFMCEECGKSFTQAASLRTHKVIHTGLKAFVCHVCSKAFTHAGNLKTHKLTHTGQKSFLCDECSMVFTRASNLKKHKMIHSGDRPFVCEVCSKGFTRADELTKHRMTHTGEKPFKCQVCDKTFTMASILKRHQVIHTGEKPFVCDVCSKAFSEEGNLKRHKMIHTGTKPFLCEVCTKTFVHAGDLKKHKMTHTGERPFRCEVCSKTFTLAGSLKRHKMTHRGPLQSALCEACSTTCPQPSLLKPHTLSHPGQKSFVCHVCRHTFTQLGTVFYAF